MDIIKRFRKYLVGIYMSFRLQEIYASGKRMGFLHKIKSALVLGLFKHLLFVDNVMELVDDFIQKSKANFTILFTKKDMFSLIRFSLENNYKYVEDREYDECIELCNRIIKYEYDPSYIYEETKDLERGLVVLEMIRDKRFSEKDGMYYRYTSGVPDMRFKLSKKHDNLQKQRKERLFTLINKMERRRTNTGEF